MMNGRQPNLPTPEQIKRMTNPTGGSQTPTPWKAGEHTISADVADAHVIYDSEQGVIAHFHRKEDRDFALFWANTHAGVISLLRGFKCGFEFVAKGEPEGSGARHYATTQAELAGIWEEFFTTLGASARRHANDAEERAER
jgi:hypothetical protein